MVPATRSYDHHSIRNEMHLTTDFRCKVDAGMNKKEYTRTKPPTEAITPELARTLAARR